MSSGKFLGFFGADKKLYLVETAGQVPARKAVIPLLATDDKDDVLTGDIRITGLIQRALRDERISVNQVIFSIPTSETIIRSFLIPSMNSGEIESAVEFEI